MRLPLCFCLAAFVLGSSFVLGDDDFNPRRAARPFKAIVTPETVGAADSAPWVNDDELVLGVVVGKEARAYPLNMLTSPTREIINDKLGGRAIAATW